MSDQSPAVAAPDIASMVRRLEKRADFWQQSSSTLTHSEREYFEILDRRAATLLAKLGQGWIPVSERLPEHGVDVMIYHVLGDTDRPEVPHAYDVGWLLKDGWYFPWDRGRDRQRPMFVTHWMPLPPPPERP